MIFKRYIEKLHGEIFSFITGIALTFFSQSNQEKPQFLLCSKIIVLIQNVVFLCRESSLINWTSGTTGMPKGVVLSQQHMYFYLR